MPLGRDSRSVLHKPCPWCNGVRHTLIISGDTVSIGCLSCEAMGPVVVIKKEHHLKSDELWNLAYTAWDDLVDLLGYKKE